MTSSAAILPFSAPYAPTDESLADDLLRQSEWEPAMRARIKERAAILIRAVRERNSKIGGLDDLLREYSLSTQEGLALMMLAEALLRVPDDATADRLIAEKLAFYPRSRPASGQDPLLVTMADWALGTTAQVIAAGTATDGFNAFLARHIGTPTIRVAARRAMRILGDHFVLGRTIEEGLARARADHGALYYSFDMLGEGARTFEDAKRYYAAYARAIEILGRKAGPHPLPARPGISIKLSALHPRYEARKQEMTMPELLPAVTALAQQAKAYDLNFTIDAEEADRLEFSLDIVDALLRDPSLDGWDGFGLAVQAYQKRALAVIDHVIAHSRQQNRRVMIRLVKGAYWDTEIKRAQERGLADYPVFTRKAMTDLNYIACAKRLLAARDHVYPQFATHNALTIASIVEYAKGANTFEFQRLHGMGEDLYAALHRQVPESRCRVYAPIGAHEHLLPYLVRRLLENGANSSFVSRLGDPDVPIDALLIEPHAAVGEAAKARSARLRLPCDLHMPERKTAPGIEFGDRKAVTSLLNRIAEVHPHISVMQPVVDTNNSGKQLAVLSPIDGTKIGNVYETMIESLPKSLEDARAGFRAWSRVTVSERAACLDRCAERLEAEAPELLWLLQKEAGKTLDDAVGEWREAIDFCRYYAAEARRRFGDVVTMPGPVGESNIYMKTGRGIFVCISPWNFPLSIFIGQIAAALVTGNAVLVKPAEQTPLIAAKTVTLLLESGIPTAALHLFQGDGKVGQALVALPGIAGVVFTGSEAVAQDINRTLAQKGGPIATLIAETGGINAMIVEASAQLEQVCDDVLASAFRSTGQRCSSLRLLCLQEEIADACLHLILGAVQTLRVGDPAIIETDLGPVIDETAYKSLHAYIETARPGITTLYAGKAPSDVPSAGYYIAPQILELETPETLDREVFGPVLHVLRYKAEELDKLLNSLDSMGYGLTLSIHSRLESVIERIRSRRLAGNIYINRNMIGAVVGTQPFGGFGLSGTGPKAGGPSYLDRFCTEMTITTNTAAAGGDAKLINNTF
ncbi:bifunctional proline dehydrogenase/L-glutamate gamma-semialdehyde dehydrogenase PutA [Beijerinckia mobilis]|uniref:bifunctional proline dehydrogenase/L-glutamate gamma-semialdehyde dehydrogenase PutA n=1 Tax=Beijerinckia mobilis TaxID=231434 RepID=UPI00054D3C4D|nr:bifunctional proline dehydrogenase/L-glutamate gamma-semialdehyde dehydrogenase PutA [Beijerinckia mobilis]